MKKNPFARKRRAPEEMALQITSMADIFTIILVFLLKSYSTSAINVTPTDGMKLPQAQVSDQAVEAVRVEVSQGAVQVEQKPVATLTNFRFDPKDLQGSGVSSSLSSALKIQRERQNLIARSNPDVKVDQKILIVADERTPYTTIKSVLASAAVHGFTDFKLVVAKKE